MVAPLAACAESATSALDTCAPPAVTMEAEGQPLVRPGLRVSFPEPTFGTCLERMSDHLAHHHADVVHAGARHQAWSSDLALIAMRTRQVIRSSDSSVVAELPEADVPWVWSPTEPSVLFATRGTELLRFDLATGALTTAARFVGYRSLVTALGLAELADDGQRAIVVGTSEDGVCAISVHDLGVGPLASLRCPTDAVARAVPPRAVALSPTGRSALVQWGPGAAAALEASRQRNVLELRDGALAWVRDLATDVRAWDVALDELGREWAVVAVGHDRSPTTIEAQPLAGDATAMVIGELDWHDQVDISCQARGANACVITTTRGNVAGSPDGVVWRVALPSGGASASPLLALAHHHSQPDFVSSLPTSECALAPEAVLPRATLRRDGREVLFGSSWGDNCFGELYRIRP